MSIRNASGVLFVVIWLVALSSNLHAVRASTLNKHKMPPHNEGTKKHNVKYDHEAFLGKEDADKFDKMSESESVKKLKELVESRVDTDKDKSVSEAELRVWLEHTHLESAKKEAENNWRDLKMRNKTALLDWPAYKKYHFGDNPNDEEAKRDKKRWKVADLDGDNKLSFDEFTALMHPENFARMSDLLIDETLAESDKNKDGKIDLNEYLKDLHPEHGDEKKAAAGKKEPKWVVKERENFAKEHDRNGDGFLDRAEVAGWVMPSKEDAVAKELRHLLAEADANKDGALSLPEILEKHETFAGSVATHYGDLVGDPEEDEEDEHDEEDEEHDEL